jgi:hypothetical protein
MEFKNVFEQDGRRVKSIRTDGGGEYRKQMAELCLQRSSRTSVLEVNDGARQFCPQFLGELGFCDNSSDICGWITPNSLGDARYFITFIDDASATQKEES